MAVLVQLPARTWWEPAQLWSVHERCWAQGACRAGKACTSEGKNKWHLSTLLTSGKGPRTEVNKHRNQLITRNPSLPTSTETWVQLFLAEIWRGNSGSNPTHRPRCADNSLQQQQQPPFCWGSCSCPRWLCNLSFTAGKREREREHLLSAQGWHEAGSQALPNR